MKSSLNSAKFAMLGAAITLAASLLSPPMTAHADTLLPWSTNFSSSQAVTDHFTVQGNFVLNNGFLELPITESQPFVTMSSREKHDELLGRVEFEMSVPSPAGSSTIIDIGLTSISGTHMSFEFLGKDSTSVESSYGIGNYNNAKFHALAPGDGTDDFHKYSIVWPPIHVQWLIDGQVVRTTLTPTGLLNGTFSVYANVMDACAPSSPTEVCDSVGGIRNTYSVDITNYKARFRRVAYAPL